MIGEDQRNDIACVSPVLEEIRVYKEDRYLSTRMMIARFRLTTDKSGRVINNFIQKGG